MGRQTAAQLLGLALAVALVGGCTSSEVRKQRHFEQGNQYASKGEYPQAIIEYRSAIQIDEKFGQARYRLALAYERTGDMSQAFREFMRAADLMPDDKEVQLRATSTLVLAGRYEDAAVRARKLLGRDPKNVDAFVLLGRASAGLKDSDAALALLEQATKQLPGDPRLQESIGELQRTRGNLAGAESSFKRAIALAPKALGPRQALAAYYFSVGRTAEAEQTLKEALPLESSGSPVTRDLAVLYFLQGRDAEAGSHFLKILRESPNDAPFHLALGDLYARNRRFDEAIKAYDLLAQNPKTFATAAARMAYADYESGRKEAAHKRLTGALARAPKDADLLTMSARLLLADKKFREAEFAAKAALEAEPDRFEPLYVMGSAAIEQGKTEEALPLLRQAATVAPKAVGPKIQLGRVYLERGDTKTALQFARDAVAIAPAQPLAQLLLVRVYTAAGDASNAEQALKPMLHSYPNSPQTQSAAGNVALLKNDTASARTAYAKALELDPASAEALSGMVLIELKSKRPNEAVALANRSVAEHPGDLRLLMLAARTYLAAKDTKRAEDALQQALKASTGSSSFEVYGMLAGIYFNEKRLDEAKVAFETLAKQQPGAIAPPTMIGIILQLQGKPKEAQAVYQRLLQTNPNAAVAANNMAMLLADSGESLDVALNHAQAARQVLPQDAAVNDTLGWVYYKKGLSTLAISSFNVSIARDPANPVYQYHLGLAYAQSGDKYKARQSLERALKIKADFEGADEARKVLKSIGG